MRRFVLDFPYSNVGPSQLMPGENAECACQALRDIFEWLGGVPPRIVFDNAAGVGRRMFERVRLTRLFQSFQAHYGFEYVFCNAYAGHEKGGVESRVGAVRRKLFVPVPSVRGACRRLISGCLNGASRWATRTTTAREVARRTCLPRTARRCWRCRRRASTWSRGNA